MKAIYVIIAAALVMLIHFGTLKLGIDIRREWVDMPLHLLGGMFLAMIWWWILDKKVEIKDTLLHVFGFLGFVSLGSTLWELYEYSLWYYYTQIAETYQFFSPAVSDVLSDMSLALVGGLCVAFIYLLIKRKNNLNIDTNG